MSELKIIVCSVADTIGRVTVNLFGRWTLDLATLVILMVVNFVMKLALEVILHKSNKRESGILSNKECRMSLLKKIAALLFVVMAYRFDILHETDYIRRKTINNFIRNESISIVENAKTSRANIVLTELLTSAGIDF